MPAESIFWSWLLRANSSAAACLWDLTPENSQFAVAKSIIPYRIAWLSQPIQPHSKASRAGWEPDRPTGAKTQPHEHARVPLRITFFHPQVQHSTEQACSKNELNKRLKQILNIDLVRLSRKHSARRHGLVRSRIQIRQQLAQPSLGWRVLLQSLGKSGVPKLLRQTLTQLISCSVQRQTRFNQHVE